MNIEQLTQLLPQLAFDNDKAGGALTIFKEGNCIAQSAFGQANANEQWTPQTLSVNFSIGKGVMATLIAVLVSKGLLEYDKPISHYWREFGVNGKEQITLLDILTHRAGLYHIGTVIKSNDDVKDWQGMLAKVASMPMSTPIDQDKYGYVSAYSALVSGWILGGVVEKVTNLPLQHALDNHLAKPLGVAGELFFGLPMDKYDTLALPERLWAGQNNGRKPTLKPDSQATKAFFESLSLWQDEQGNKSTAVINKKYFDPSFMNLTNYKNALLADGRTPIDYHANDVIGVPIPAANGVSSSHALATIYAMHANDGIWQDHVMIDKPTLAKMRTIYSDGLDAVMPANMRWRAGFHRLFTVNHAPNAYGHMGYNGSVAFCDPDRRLAVAFIHNFDTTMLNDIRQFVVSEMALML